MHPWASTPINWSSIDRSTTIPSLPYPILPPPLRFQPSPQKNPLLLLFCFLFFFKISINQFKFQLKLKFKLNQSILIIYLDIDDLN